MNKHLLTCCTIAGVLSACGSAPHASIPDGRSRVPANSQVAIDEYKARSATVQASRSANSEMSSQLEYLKRELGQVKRVLAILAGDRGRGVASTDQASNKGGSLYANTANESIQENEGSMVFRLMHRVGATAFTPTSNFKDALLAASKTAGVIEVRGRSDADLADETNRRIAAKRAATARHFLITHGVDPDKIRVSSLAAGGFVAENKTRLGKARNRRVEIEITRADFATNSGTATETKGGDQ